MSELLEVLSQSGVDRFVRALARSSDSSLPRPQHENTLADFGTDNPSATFDDLISQGIIQRIGSRFGISGYGQRVALLLEAMDGGDIEDVITRLRRLDGLSEQYELVRQGMTTRFLKTLADRPLFGRLYFCSPWINLNAREASLVHHGMLRSQKPAVGKQPEILVITRPLGEVPEETRGKGLGLQPFVELGARIYFLRNVHTKLYIREPDENGGFSLAVVGSENLTQSNHLELGIQINGDSRLISQLISHFYELASYSSENR